MQTQQPNQSAQALQSLQAAQPQVSPQPWVKPTFEQVPLNEALEHRSSNHSRLVLAVSVTDNV